MAERIAPWLLDGVSTGAVEARLFSESMLDQVGVVGPTDMVVTATGGMNIQTSSGRAFILMSTAWNGVTHVVNDSGDTNTVQASEANPRRDLVIAEVTGSSWQTRIVKGTAAASPVDPAVPVNCIVLARINLTASAASVTAAMLEDLRPFASPLRSLQSTSALRNWIRNGDMGIAQRGNGPFTTIYDTYLDGFRAGVGGAGSLTLSRVATPLGSGMGVNGANWLMRLTTAGQSAAGDNSLLYHPIENVRSLAGRVVTLSFMAQAGAGTPKIGIELEQIFGTGGSPSATVTTAIRAIQISTTATRYSVTFTVPSVASKAIGTSGTDRLQILFWLSAGANNATRASSIGIQNATIDLTDIQLEDGPVATAFERIPVALQLLWNSRYLQRLNGSASGNVAVGSGLVSLATQAVFTVPWLTPMRAVPSVTVSSMTVWDGSTQPAVSALSFSGTPESPTLTATVSGGLTVGRGALLYQNGVNMPSYIQLSAEL